MTEIPPQLNPSQKALNLLSRANRMRILRESLQLSGENWIADDLPHHFERGYAMSELRYRTSSKRSRVYSSTAGYVDADGNPTAENLTYDEKKQNLQGHQDPLVWTGRLRQQVFEQARCTATAVQGTSSDVRGRISFGRLAVGGPGSYRNLFGAGVPAVIRETLVGGPSGLPAREIEHIGIWYRDNALAYIQSLSPEIKRLPPPPPVLADRRETLAAQRARALSGAMAGRDAVRRHVGQRRASLAAKHSQWRAQSGGAAPIGGAARSDGEAREAHRFQSALSYWRGHARILARRRARYRQLNSPLARAARRQLGLNR